MAHEVQKEQSKISSASPTQVSCYPEESFPNSCCCFSRQGLTMFPYILDFLPVLKQEMIFDPLTSQGSEDLLKLRDPCSCGYGNCPSLNVAAMNHQVLLDMEDSDEEEEYLEGTDMYQCTATTNVHDDEDSGFDSDVEIGKNQSDCKLPRKDDDIDLFTLTISENELMDTDKEQYKFEEIDSDSEKPPGNKKLKLGIQV